MNLTTAWWLNVISYIVLIGMLLLTKSPLWGRKMWLALAGAWLILSVYAVWTVSHA